MYPPYEMTVQSATETSDGIGGVISTWSDRITLTGYIDMVNGSDLPTGVTDNAFIENSTHVAIIPDGAPGPVTDKDRIVCKGRAYDITFVDDPLGIGHHLEIYLRYSGGES